LDPTKRTPLALRVRTLLALLRETFACAIRLPFFLFPFLVHFPVYVLGRLGASLVVDEEETFAQMKVVLGLLAMLMVYPAMFLFLWALLLFSPIGAIVAGGVLYLFAVYHNRLVNRAYIICHPFFKLIILLLQTTTCGRFAPRRTLA
jgi:glycerol-3-phosphate O-acyltransferase/dihydroxyacetone phosphate acyltransferase